MLIAILAVWMLSALALGDEIALRSAARLPAGATEVTLADVAEFSGEYANSLAGVVVATLSGPPRVIELSVQEVRQKLDAAGAHWGKINLQGGRVVIRPRAQANINPPSAMQPVSLNSRIAEVRNDDEGVSHRLLSEFAEENTVRGAVGRYIAAGLHAQPNAVQLAFDARDEALLIVSASQYRIEVEAVSSLRSDRIQMVVRLWDGMRIAQNATLTVLPRVRSDAVVAARDLSDGTKLQPSDLAMEELWLSPSRSGWLTDVAAVADRVLDRSVKAGERLEPKHLRKHIIIRRGDRAKVRCLVGGIVISLEVECRQEGAEGETVEFRKLGERETFFATVTAPGEAVMDLSTNS
jgi:flagella basal body P-ring formation protein FlgA